MKETRTFKVHCKSLFQWGWIGHSSSRLTSCIFKSWRKIKPHQKSSQVSADSRILVRLWKVLYDWRTVKGIASLTSSSSIKNFLLFHSCFLPDISCCFSPISTLHSFSTIHNSSSDPAPSKLSATAVPISFPGLQFLPFLTISLSWLHDSSIFSGEGGREFCLFQCIFLLLSWCPASSHPY